MAQATNPGSAPAEKKPLAPDATPVATANKEKDKEIAEKPEKATQSDRFFVHDISPGDSLQSIFRRYDIDLATMYRVIEADEALLALDILRPGNRLSFTMEKADEPGEEAGKQLKKMELYIHPASQVVYHRLKDGSFEYEEVLIYGNWKQEIITGEIHGSLYRSAQLAGLKERETNHFASLFKDQIDFSREIRAGDQFQIVISRQFVGEEYTGQSRIKGARILRGNRTYSAFRCEDGNYFDHNGESLERAFRRLPTDTRFRVSSSFNPTRRHPVTGRVAPHNGVDFAMPTGTPVLSTGDGVVSRVGDHPFAGKYVEIRHGSQYQTRYLHLHRILVRQGQAVKRGERIALSGNTGRSTGPHLHFELHRNGRPVNPLTANIPMAASVSKERSEQFRSKVNRLVGLMESRNLELARKPNN